MNLHPHQVTAEELLRDAIRAGRRRIIVMLPTGGGKTHVGIKIIKGARAKGKRVVFCAPVLELIDQTVERFGSEGITDLGVIQAQHALTDWSQPIQVASIQTLARRNLPHADVVIVDECHLNSKVIQHWMQDRPEILFVGLRATPWRKGLGKHWDALVIGATTAELIETGYLSPFRVFAPSHPDLTGVRTVGGDYHEADLSAAMDKPQLVADVVATWLAKGEDRPTLCFAVDTAHARSLHNAFVQAGVSSGYMDAYTSREDRDRIKQAFARGEIKVICNVGVLTTGVDLDVRCLILARPTKSEMLFVQIIGRGLRTAPGKADCIILDHSDTTLRLGFVDDIVHEELDDGTGAKAATRERGGKAERLPKECSECTYLKDPGVHACPNCGFAPQRQNKIEFLDGDLVQIKGSKAKFTAAEKQEWYSGLLWIARERHYREGWADNKYRSKFGVWPRNLHHLARPPSRTILSWVKSEQIRWAKRRPDAEVHHVPA